MATGSRIAVLAGRHSQHEGYPPAIPPRPATTPRRSASCRQPGRGLPTECAVNGRITPAAAPGGGWVRRGGHGAWHIRALRTVPRCRPTVDRSPGNGRISPAPRTSLVAPPADRQDIGLGPPLHVPPEHLQLHLRLFQGHGALGHQIGHAYLPADRLDRHTRGVRHATGRRLSPLGRASGGQLVLGHHRSSRIIARRGEEECNRERHGVAASTRECRHQIPGDTAQGGAGSARARPPGQPAVHVARGCGCRGG